MGGETALTNNDRFVKHQVTIMEKRVKNSAVSRTRVRYHVLFSCMAAVRPCSHSQPRPNNSHTLLELHVAW